MIDDLPKIINKDTTMILYADDTSILLTDSNTCKVKFNIYIYTLTKHFKI